jgi:prepilin-type processing-associated H-X9-DG protein
MTGFAQYTQDYDERTMPFYVAAPNGPYLNHSSLSYWPDLIYPYVKSGVGRVGTDGSARGIFGCPSTNSVISSGNDDHWLAVRYAYNQSNINNDPIVFDTGSSSEGVSLAQLGHPAETITFSEGLLGSGPWLSGTGNVGNAAALQAAYPTSGGFPAGYSPDRPILRASRTSATLYDSMTKGKLDENGASHSAAVTDRTLQAHFEGANYAFADGHVKFLKRTTMKQWTANS